jgi:hypothetical protein
MHCISIKILMIKRSNIENERKIKWFHVATIYVIEKLKLKCDFTYQIM